MVPWGLLRVRDKPASLYLPMVRRLGISADHRPAANYVLPGAANGRIRVAMVADPTDDLPGARREQNAPGPGGGACFAPSCL